MAKFRIVIPRTGVATGDAQPRAIYSGETAKMLSAAGTTATARASHVEPGHGLSQAALAILESRGLATRTVVGPEAENGPRSGTTYHIQPAFREHWFADMTPCGHSVVLGPFGPAYRDVALAEEVKWLLANNIPTATANTVREKNLYANRILAIQQAISTVLDRQFPAIIHKLMLFRTAGMTGNAVYFEGVLHDSTRGEVVRIGMRYEFVADSAEMTAATASGCQGQGAIRPIPQSRSFQFEFTATPELRQRLVQAIHQHTQHCSANGLRICMEAAWFIAFDYNDEHSASNTLIGISEVVATDGSSETRSMKTALTFRQGTAEVEESIYQFV